MSGRAGRRGKDKRGIVIQMLDEKVEPNDVKGILKGNADPLNSSFHLSYNMLLNLMRVEDADPEYIIKHSFFQYQKQQKTPLLQNEIQQIQSELSSLTVTDEKEVAKYYNLSEKLNKAEEEYRNKVYHSDAVIKFITSGRIIRVKVLL